MRQLSRHAVMALCAAVLAVAPVNGLDRLDEGIYRLNFDRIDDLLTLEENPDVKVLFVDVKRPKVVSDAHLRKVREWAQQGGILWAVEEGLESAVAKAVAPFRFDRFNYKKSATGKRGGELVVKGVSERLTIATHPLTEDVSQLYLYPRYRFDGTRSAVPIVEMTDTKGNHGLVIAAIPAGQGYLVLDGTARRKRAIFGRLRGFDENHPNAVKQEDSWNSYDWSKLLENARALAARQLGIPAL